MAYAARQGSERITGVVAVAGIHAAIGAALIIGLAPPIFQIVDPPRIIGLDIRDKPKDPPPPPSNTNEKQEASVITTSAPPFDLNQTPSDTKVEIADDNPIPQVFPTATPTTPPFVETPQPPVAQFTPKRPQPVNAQNSWVTTTDYPSGDLRRGHEGTVGYRLVIGTNGKVQSCEVTASSGWPGLDEAACKNVSRRARFEAGTNDKGQKVVDTYSGRVIWRIPE